MPQKMGTQNAIIVRNARKQYGNGVQILDGLNLSVPRGCIYGLLGASGCGKTTLLSCVVGVKKLDSGDLWVLGGLPRSKKSGIPGPRVGYMPQDVSLVKEFSVIGTLYFFGRINGLDDYAIEERYLYLKDLLQLPPRDRLVKNMSGGQQRRVSFAAALLHQPELLILDEPTVGLDPVLRDNIWNHLVKITHEEGATVIITTHYIEEAKQSNKIGLLRGGRLLAESSPTELLEQCQTDSLEEAFLTLSQIQGQNEHRHASNQISNAPPEMSDFLGTESMYGKYVPQSHRQLHSTSSKRCKALLVKNGLQFVRDPGGVMFSLILPVLQILLFFNAIGLEPKDMSISIVNDEAGNCDNGRYHGNIMYNETENICTFEDLSCRFIAGLNTSLLRRRYYDDYNEALDRVGKDKSIGIMYFHRNFSRAYESRLEDFLSITDDTITASEIQIEIHTPDRQIVLLVQQVLYNNFITDHENIMKACGLSAKYGNVPLNFEKPVFGSKDQNFLSFVAPPFLLSTLFVLATSITSSIIVTDRNSGVWDRTLVQGVTTPEILLTHLISQISIIILQVIAALCLCFLHFDLKCEGSMLIVIGLAILEGICGMSYGFFISVMCTSHAVVNYASVGSFYPLLLFCGLIWPIQGMPKFLQYISIVMPLTLPGISLRGVMEKGTSVDEPEVYTGFIVVTAWILGLIGICLFRMKAKAS